jgi:hypothetical protein
MTWDVSNGRVGINTTAPQAPLHVTRARDTVISQAAATARIGGDDVHIYFGALGASPYWPAWIQAWGDAGNSAPLLLNPQGGNIGIGTSSPTEKLHVTGNAYFGPAGGGIAANALKIEDQSTFRRIAFDDLRFYDWSYGNDMVTFKDGNVGIGTTSPYAKLEVVGGIRLNTTSSKPTCDANQRGTLWFEQSASGTDDYLWACMQNSTAAYNWVLVARGG